MHETVARKILDYLNGDILLLDLVHWSEDTLALLLNSDDDVSNEPALLHILGYIGAGDSGDFPLTWEILSQFLEQLGVRVRVTAETV